MVKTVDSHTEFQQILADAGDKAVIVDFTASWCGPCKMIGPKFVEFAEQYDGKIISIKVDVDENSETAEWAKISAMPTFKVYKNSAEVATMTGANEANLKQLFESHS